MLLDDLPLTLMLVLMLSLLLILLSLWWIIGPLLLLVRQLIILLLAIIISIYIEVVGCSICQEQVVVWPTIATVVMLQIVWLYHFIASDN